MQIIKDREHHTVTRHHLFFHFEGEPGNGFGWDCGPDYVVDVATLNPDALRNYQACLAGVSHNTTCPSTEGMKIVGPFRQSWEQSWSEPAVGLCEVCGAEVQLDGFTCTCDNCGADYNSCGQRLASREQWGDETGEHLADILRIQ